MLYSCTHMATVGVKGLICCPVRRSVVCLLADTWKTMAEEGVSRHDARMSSLCNAVDALFRRVYDTLSAVIAVAFLLYAVIVVVAARVTLNTGPPSPSRHCRSPCLQSASLGVPDDIIRPTTTQLPAVGRAAFSETKV